jgi:hypothetical protein
LEIFLKQQYLQMASAAGNILTGHIVFSLPLTAIGKYFKIRFAPAFRPFLVEEPVTRLKAR